MAKVKARPTGKGQSGIRRALQYIRNLTADMIDYSSTETVKDKLDDLESRVDALENP